MNTIGWLVVIAASSFVAWRIGRRDRWIEPHCYCRGNQPGHACLTACWEGRRLRSEAFARHMRRPAWLRWLHNVR